MSTSIPNKYEKAKVSRMAIENIYIEMRHFFNRGFYKPFGVSGKEMSAALKTLNPEIYGSISNPKKVELKGLIYVIERLPKGIEACRFIRLISDEGYSDSNFEKIIPQKRRRNCYRIDSEQLCIEITRGRSEIYDILTHLTFLYIEADKIRNNAFDEKGIQTREWGYLQKIVQSHEPIKGKALEVAYTHLSTLLGRTFEEVKDACIALGTSKEHNNGLFEIVYQLGKLAIEEEQDKKWREIRFTPVLRERIGQHIYGEQWAMEIKQTLEQNHWLKRPLHIISPNMHSVKNTLYAYPALRNELPKNLMLTDIAKRLEKDKKKGWNDKIDAYAEQHGFISLTFESGTNLNVQLIDTAQLDLKNMLPSLLWDDQYIRTEKPIILVMDYAFGEQAYETMDELLKPYPLGNDELLMNVESISIMGKAGILCGGKGDIMIPDSHIFEGTADNYPFENQITAQDFEACDLQTFRGSMITVLGTSLQNKAILHYFKETSWKSIGLEMEGAHYQKAIQAASSIRKNISNNIKLSYAYYASDNPLETGSTLASGSLGEVGIHPTYSITKVMLKKILNGFQKEIVSESKAAG